MEISAIQKITTLLPKLTEADRDRLLELTEAMVTHFQPENRHLL